MAKVNVDVNNGNFVQNYRTIRQLSSLLPYGSTPVEGFSIRTQSQQSELNSQMVNYDNSQINASELQRALDVDKLSKYYDAVRQGNSNTYVVSELNDVTLEEGDVIRVNVLSSPYDTTDEILFVIGGENQDYIDEEGNFLFELEPGKLILRYEGLSGKVAKIEDSVSSVVNYTNVTPDENIEVTQTALALPVGKSYAGSATVNNLIYIMGGYDTPSGTIEYTDSNYEFNPITQSWRVRASMATRRNNFGIAEIRDRIYCFGGYNGTTTLDTVEEYNPSNNTWRSRESMENPRRRLTASGDNIVSIYCMGGVGTTENAEYNVQTNMWRGRRGMLEVATSGTSQYVSPYIYHIGGRDNDEDPVAYNQRYSISSNFWSYARAMPKARCDLGSGVINGNIYCIGGHDGSNPLDINEVYIVDTGRWESRLNVPRAKHGLTCSTVYNTIYCLGGDTGVTRNKSEFYTERPLITYINGGKRVEFNHETLVHRQIIPANEKTKIETSGFLVSLTDNSLTGYIGL